MKESVMQQTDEGAAPTATPVAAAHPARVQARRARKLREAALAYLFLLPALLIIGLFGLFPLVFSIYQSTLRGLNTFTGRYGGMFNYVRAIDELAYVLGFWLAIAFVAYAGYSVLQMRRQAAARGEQPWLLALPAAVMTAGVVAFGLMGVRLLGALLLIPGQLTSFENRSAQFRQLIGEALRTLPIAQPLLVSVLLITLAVALYIGLARRAVFAPHAGGYLGTLTAVGVLLALAGLIAWFTYSDIQVAYSEALDAGTELAIWAQIVTISAGIVLLLLSWLVWRGAADRASNRSTFLRLMAASMLIVGAWVLIGELPAAVADADRAWLTGLQATVFYSLGTVPLQLAFGLLLAVLLFQDFRGKGAFRVIYFLPYITPTVAAAAVFRVFFSARPSAPMNNVLTTLGLPPLAWLAEPAGIVQLITGDAVNVSGFWAGPSLALVVIMLYSIWTFVGFNVVIFLAGLGNIGREMYEAASIDGAGRWPLFRHITLPLLSPSIYFLTLWSVIGTFKAFNHIWVLRLRAALGTTDTASVVIFNAFKRDTRYGYASALAVLLLIIILLLTYANNRLSRDRVFYG